jgi:hypothetical protein
VGGEWKGRPLLGDLREPDAAVSLVFQGCNDAASGAACETSATVPGQIATRQPLVGTLGFISGPIDGAPPEERIRIGLDLRPEEPSTTVLAFECGGPPDQGGEAWTLEGSVIGQLRPQNEMTSTYRLTFKSHGAEQVTEAFVGAPPDTLTARRVGASGTSEEAVGLTLRGEHGAITAQGEEALEFKAKP